MPKTHYSATEAAQALGISVDTLRRWDREGRIKTTRDKSNKRVVAAREIARVRGDDAQHLSARNRFRGTVTDVKVDGLLAQIEMTITDPARLVAIITRDAAEELGLKRGQPATAIVKSTSIMVEH